MDIVQDFIGANRIHIRVEPFTDIEAISRKGHTLPFGQRLHDFGLGAIVAPDIETDRLFSTV